MIETRAPGKLFIAGEYAIIEPGRQAVLIAVDRYLTVRLTPTVDVGRVLSGMHAAPLVWTRDSQGASVIIEHQPYDYVIEAITVAEQLRADLGIAPQYFDLTITSELEDADGHKFGLGSSAAVTVAVIAALDEFYGFGLDRAQRLKLALLATFAVAPNASGGDVAASTYGGWIRYGSPDRAEVASHRAEHGVASTITHAPWTGLAVERLPHPGDLRLLVGWTGSPASTERLVRDVQGSGSQIADDDFLRRSDATVADLARALLDDDVPGTLASIRTARRLLRDLGERHGIPIETPRLRDLCDIAERSGAAAKPSGAGGGDCGVALVDHPIAEREIGRGWESHGVRRLMLAVHPATGGTDGI